MVDLRPKRIDLYIFKKFIFSFFIALLLIIGIVIIFDISEKINDFVANNAPLEAIIFDYYVNFIPYFMNMFSPLFVFLTVIFFTSRMAANSEIIAILSSGISFHRMMLPYMGSALLIALLSLGLNLWVIPNANNTRLDFEAQYVKHHNDYKHRNIHYQIAPGQFVFVETFSSWNNAAYRFTLEDVKDGRLVSKLSAEMATWDTTVNAWRLRNYVLREYTDGLEDHIKTGTTMDTLIPLRVEDFYRNEKTVERLPIDQLTQLIDTQKMRGDANVQFAQIELHNRFSLPFSAFILTIIGVSLSSKKKRGGIGWNIALGIGLSFTYILFMRFSQMFVYTGTLPPWIAIWLPNLVFTIIAAVMYRLAPK